MRREKSLRNSVHHANAVVWGPVYRTRLTPGGMRSRASPRAIANSAGMGCISKYGGAPVRSSMTTHATDQTSDLGSSPGPRISITSGAIQW